MEQLTTKGFDLFYRIISMNNRTSGRLVLDNLQLSARSKANQELIRREIILGAQSGYVDSLMINERDKSTSEIMTIDSSFEINYDDDADEYFSIDMIYDNNDNNIM